MQLFVGDWTVSSQVSFSVTESKWQYMGPSYSANVGGSHVQESISSHRDLMLLEKKSQKCCGSSEWETWDGRGVVCDLLNSSLDTEKPACLPAQTDMVNSVVSSVIIQLSLSHLDTWPCSSPLLNKDISVHFEVFLYHCWAWSPLLSCLPDLRHPSGGGLTHPVCSLWKEYDFLSLHFFPRSDLLCLRSSRSIYNSSTINY